MQHIIRRGESQNEIRNDNGFFRMFDLVYFDFCNQYLCDACIFCRGSVTSFSDFAIKTTGGWLCPQDTTPESYSYSTTTHDQNGFEQPTTAYELHCVNTSGEVVKSDPIVFSLLWIGIFAAAGLLLSAILSFVFAVPGGILVTRLLEKLCVKKTVTTI